MFVITVRGRVIVQERERRKFFGIQTRYNLADGFPAMTTKKLYFKSVAHELLWFLKGTGNIEYLAQNGVHIWDEWPYKKLPRKNRSGYSKRLTATSGALE